MKPVTVDYATPARATRLPAWMAVGGPLILFGAGIGGYAGSRWLWASGLTAQDAFLTARTVLEGLSPLLLAAGTLWGVVAAIRTRKLAALSGLILCAAALVYVVYHVFLSVKR